MREFVWECVLHWHPEAAAAGVPPRDADTHPRPADWLGGPDWSGGPDPAAYRPLRFLFAAPPGPADLLAAVRPLVWFSAIHYPAVEAAVTAAAGDWPVLHVPDVVLARVAGDVRLGPAGRPVGRVVLKRLAVQPVLPPPPRTRAVARRRRTQPYA